MENKKTKLSISGSPKKSFKNFESSKSKGKKTVVIDKPQGRSFNKGGFNKPTGSNFKRNSSVKTNFPPKAQPVISDFERRKLAEQRATKRLKGDSEGEKKSKIGSKKLKKDAKEFLDYVYKCREIGEQFGYFMNNEWIFDNATAI